MITQIIIALVATIAIALLIASLAVLQEKATARKSRRKFP
jgi:hypothetical protein